MTSGNSALALSVSDLTIQFGGLKAVSGITLSLEKGSIYGLIGPNGAGKTTFFNLLTGVYQPTSGTAEAFGKNLIGKRPFEIARDCHVARTFQNIRLFKELSVLDNVRISMDHDRRLAHYGVFSGVVRTSAMISKEEEVRKKSLELLSIFKLDLRYDEKAKNLPYGDQRRLEIARAMATGAELLLLDEPAAGMNPLETQDLMSTIQLVIQKFAVTVLLIEHDMKLVMGICRSIAVLDHGVKIAEGVPSEIQNNPQVIEAYLGKAPEHGALRS